MEFLGKWTVMLFAVGLASIMALQDDLRGARVVAFLTLTVVLVFFVIFFAFGSPWYKTTEGKALLAYMASLMVVCLQATLAIFLGADYPYRELVSAILLYAATVTSVGMFYLLMRNQYATRKEIRRLRRQRDELKRKQAECDP